MRMSCWLAVLLVGSVASAETLTVLPVSGLNVHEGTLEAAGEILRGHLVHRGIGAVATPGAPGKTEIDGRTAAVQAHQAGTDGAAVLHVTRLGSTARLRLSVYAASGQLRFVDELPAASPDDMHPVLERLAAAYATGKRASDSGELTTVTAAESAAYAKRRATSIWGITLGGVVPTGGSSHDLVPGGSLFWLYDARSFLAEVAIGVHGADEASDVSLGLGAYVPFGRGDTTPYLGGGLRWAATDYGGRGGSGLQLYAAGGVLLGRLATVQIRAELSYFVNTYAETELDDYAVDAGVGLEPGGDASSHGHGMMFGLGIGF